MRTVNLLIMMLFSASLCAQEEWPPLDEATAPKIKPELIFASIYGGPGDQWFSKVGTKNGKIAAGNEDGLAIVVKINDDGSIKVDKRGDPNAVTKRKKTNKPQGGAYTYGYRQVTPLLQQPWLKVGKEELWAWSESQVKQSKARYAPFLADSRINKVIVAPNGNAIAIGTTDGGNTSLRAHPKDIDRLIDIGIGHSVTTGGARGLSTWLFNITEQGEVVEPAMVFRGYINCAAWDAWGRILVAGGGVMGPRSGSAFGYADGPGLLIASKDWTKPLFKAHIGKKDEGANTKKGTGTFLDVAIDSSMGIAVLCGFFEGHFYGVNAVQEMPGGGKDAFMAVIKLWDPRDYKKALRSN